jgi:hypothetical protein
MQKCIITINGKPKEPPYPGMDGVLNIKKMDGVYLFGTLYDCLEVIHDLDTNTVNIFLIDRYEETKRRLPSQAPLPWAQQF